MLWDALSESVSLHDWVHQVSEPIHGSAEVHIALAKFSPTNHPPFHSNSAISSICLHFWCKLWTWDIDSRWMIILCFCTVTSLDFRNGIVLPHNSSSYLLNVCCFLIVRSRNKQTLNHFRSVPRHKLLILLLFCKWPSLLKSGGLLRGSSNQANSNLNMMTIYTVWSTTNIYTLSPGFTLQKLAAVFKMRCECQII